MMCEARVISDSSLERQHTTPRHDRLMYSFIRCWQDSARENNSTTHDKGHQRPVFVPVSHDRCGTYPRR